MANITKEFLEKALQQQVESFEVNSGSNLGDGYTSLLYTIDVIIKKDKTTRHLLLKCYPTNVARQEFLTMGNIFQRELSVYNTLIPALVDFQKEFNSNGPFIKPPFADFFYGRAIDYKTMDPSASKLCTDPLENCIIMPDLRKTGKFRLANRLVGFDLDHCKLVIEAQAKFHALSWAYKTKLKLKLLTDKFQFLDSSMMDEMDPQMFNVMFDNSNSLFKGAMENAVKDQNERATLIAAIEGSRSKIDNIMDLYWGEGKNLSDPSLNKDNVLRVQRQVNNDEQPWLVALHGDSWLNNFMFRYDEETGKPLETVLVDLQMSKEGDPLSDICYSLFTSTTSAFRRRHVNKLLKIYVATFTSICEQFGVPPLPGFDLVELRRRFHRGKAFGFNCCLMGFPIFLNDASNIKNLEDIPEGKTGKDFFNEFANMTSSIKGSTRFEDRAVDVVREMYADGII